MVKVTKELKYICGLFLTTRIILTIIGVVSRLLLEPFHGKEYVLGVFSKHPWLDIWGVWDSGWYRGIAENWYPAGKTLALRFFPLYPLLMKVLGAAIHKTYFAGILISNASLIIACMYLYRLVRLDSDEETALKSIKYLFLFPSAFILSGVFTEALFLALALMCFYYAKKEKWFLAGVLGFFLSLTKTPGFLIMLPLLYAYLKRTHFKIANVKANILFLLLIPAGLVMVFAIQHRLSGDWLAFFHTEDNPGYTWPFITFYRGLIDNSIDQLYIRFSAYCTLLLVVLLTVFFKKIGFSYWLFAMILVFTPLCLNLPYIFASMFRYLVAAFPLYILFAKISKRYYADLLLSVAFGLLQGFLMVFWTNGFYLIV